MVVPAHGALLSYEGELTVDAFVLVVSIDGNVWAHVDVRRAARFYAGEFESVS